LGLEVAETPREVSFCAHAIHGTGAFVVPDALLDHRFADNPCVTEPPRVRFYAGWPVRAVDGRPVGTLCIVDRRPRELGAADLQALRDLAALVEGELARTPATLPSGPAP
jgi:GAF domain-containing protein